MKKMLLLTFLSTIILSLIITGCISKSDIEKSDIEKLEITVTEHGRTEKGYYFVIATVRNTLKEEVKGTFSLQVFNLSVHREYGGNFPDDIINWTITIPSGDSVTKNVTFQIKEDETPINIRFYRTDYDMTKSMEDNFYLNRRECTAEIPH